MKPESRPYVALLVLAAVIRGTTLISNGAIVSGMAIYRRGISCRFQAWRRLVSLCLPNEPRRNAAIGW